MKEKKNNKLQEQNMVTSQKENFDHIFWSYFVFETLVIFVDTTLILTLPAFLRDSVLNQEQRYVIVFMRAVMLCIFVQLFIRYIYCTQNNKANIHLKMSFFKKQFFLLYFIFGVIWTSLLFTYPLHHTLNPQSPYKHAVRKLIRYTELALRLYRANYGSFPPHNPNYDSKPLIIYLGGNTNNNGGATESYCNFREEELATGKILDYFGNEIHYRNATNPDGTQNQEAINKKSFDLWSEGEITKTMGDENGDDDICNWEKEYIPKYPICFSYLCCLLLVLINISWFYFSKKNFKQREKN